MRRTLAVRGLMIGRCCRRCSASCTPSSPRRRWSAASRASRRRSRRTRRATTTRSRGSAVQAAPHARDTESFHGIPAVPFCRALDERVFATAASAAASPTASAASRRASAACQASQNAATCNRVIRRVVRRREADADLSAGSELTIYPAQTRTNRHLARAKGTVVQVQGGTFEQANA